MKMKSIDKIKVDTATIENIHRKALCIKPDGNKNSASLRTKLDKLSAYFRDVFSIVESDIAGIIENNTEFKYYKEAYQDAYDRLRSYEWTSYWTPYDQRELLHRIESYVRTEKIMGIKRMDGGQQTFEDPQRSAVHMKSHYECLLMALNCLENINNKVEKGKMK